MTLKKLLKQPEYKSYIAIEIIDIPNHWSFTTNIHESFYTKPLGKYEKQLLRRKVEEVYIISDKRFGVKIY